MNLAPGLRIGPGMVISFVGAGGKSAAITRLERELARTTPVLITTTTKLAHSQEGMAERHITLRRREDLESIASGLASGKSLLVTGGTSEEQPKWIAPGRRLLSAALRMGVSAGAVVLVEADGARGRWLKAPAEHEPQIPEGSDLVVPVAGLGALGTAMGEESVHRPGRVGEVTGLEEGEIIREEHMVRLLSSRRGALKGIPRGAEVRILLNQADTPERVIQARAIALSLLAAERVRAVAIASLAGEDPLKRVQGRVGGIVLAAGGSTRLGRPKQLVRWHGESLAWHAVRAAKGGGCDPVCVVLGANGGSVRESLRGQSVKFVKNADWPSGLSTSLRAGLTALESNVEAVTFLLADMPLVDANLIGALAEAHATSLAPIVATQAEGQLVNPALFDRVTFEALHSLQGDSGGRQLFDRFRHRTVPGDSGILLDVDTPEDLARLGQLG